jgi:CAAX protease family protein
MTLAVLLAGALAKVVAWSMVASGRGSVWTTVGMVSFFSGVVALAVAPPPLSGGVPVWLAGVSGFAAGLALYVGTGVFIRMMRNRWPALMRDADDIYGNRGSRSGLAAAAAGVVAVGEELFWRGFAQRELAARFDSAAAAMIATLAAYVATSAASRNLSIVLAALVGGAVWGALAWWSAGVLAGIVSHVVWTTLMVARPLVHEAP